MTPQEREKLSENALELRAALIRARRDPTLSPAEREADDRLSRLCTGALVLADMLRDQSTHGPV